MKSLQLNSADSVYLDGIFLFQIKESRHPYHAEIHFSNAFPAPTITDVNCGTTLSLGMTYHLKMGEIINLGENMSILMTRFAKVKYRVSVRAPDKCDIIIK